MEIQFTNIDNLWVAEFEVTKDFNLHLERDTEGRLDIYQRTAGGEYEYIYDIGYLNKRTVYDNDFQALVYPKWIKIKSAVKPLIATITTDGEVNEVVYQAKDIEITSNGTTKVTADTGYTALGSVNVKVNVPTEGGGESASTIEYLDVSGFDGPTYLEILAIICYQAKTIQKVQTIGSMILLGEELSDIIAISYDPTILIDFNGNRVTPQELAFQVDADADLSIFPRLTKEEFYNLNA
jgi:hypothetical protein